ncbi:DUF2235 domain-containing protein [Mesorhizobium sp. M1005]|uniref:DUF2235 domain-containing protein n=1 Tax=unclassified Mesorhizobium TaxID=325217 RepID=UPI0033386F36
MKSGVWSPDGVWITTSKEAYRFLVENYDDGRDGGGGQSSRDSIYIFGFSRGAYSACVLAGFVHAVGLIEKRNLNLLDYAYRAYKGIGENGEDKFGEVRLYERILAPDRPPIRLLGLFDTVASAIEHGRYGPRLRSHAFTKRNWSVESVRHAVAIDERRTMFRPRLWPQGKDYWGNPFNKAAAKPQDVREVWFAGVHGDVGGGYPEAESGLTKIALQWMIEQTRPTGLFYRTQTVNDLVLGQNPDKPYVAPDPHASQHNSMTWAWSLLEFIPQWRRKGDGVSQRGRLIIPFFARRSIPSGARIHQSVIDRAKSGGPLPNMPEEFLRSKRVEALSYVSFASSITLLCRASSWLFEVSQWPFHLINAPRICRCRSARQRPENRRPPAISSMVFVTSPKRSRTGKISTVHGSLPPKILLSRRTGRFSNGFIMSRNGRRAGLPEMALQTS